MNSTWKTKLVFLYQIEKNSPVVGLLSTVSNEGNTHATDDDTNKYVGPSCCRAEMYAGRVDCRPR